MAKSKLLKANEKIAREGESVEEATAHLAAEKAAGTVLLGVVGALLLGVGMCLSMVFAKMLLGIVIGVIGIVVLLMLIPQTKGLHD